MEILKHMKSEIVSLKRKQEALEFSNPPRLRKFPRLLDLTNNDIESECLTSEHASRIKTSPEKRSHIEKGKSDKCGSSISLNPVKGNHGKLPLKQTSRKERSREREKSKPPVTGTSKTPVRVQKNPVRKSIPTSRNQGESEDSSVEDYRLEDDVLKPYTSQTDGYARLLKSFEFRNGSRMADEKLVILEFKYHQNKK